MECDSAIYWPNGIFEAYSNTKVTNNETVITGDTMIYSEITGKANVKGRIVYLTDGNSTLRTAEVDFDTETEIGYFEHEGTIVDSFRTLESQRGYYYSKIKEFEFIGQVQSDTKDYVLQSDSMKYNSATKIFTFYSNTHIWSENGYLYCDKGWYDSDNDIMFFYHNSYMLSQKQEIFADSIYYENKTQKGRLYSNIQVTDTVQKTVALADYADFDMNTEDFLMRKNPSIILYDDKDSVFIRADTLYSITTTIKIPAPEVSVTDSILSDTTTLAVSDTTTLAVSDTTTLAVSDTTTLAVSDTTTLAVSDTVTFTVSNTVTFTVSDTATLAVSDTATLAVSDTTFAASITDFVLPDTTHAVSAPSSILSDTTFATSISDLAQSDTALVIDTTKYVDSTYKELFAFKNAKIYRPDFQLICDSMYFNNSDSIWKTYYNPILWDGKKMQITSDSMKFYIINGALDHADFNGNAMVVVPEGNPDTTIYFDQVKSKNMKAHLKNRQLVLFEAIGNAQTLAFSMSDFIMNITEAPLFKISFEGGKARRISYHGQSTGKNHPLFLVREDEIKLPGYRWEIDLRPKSGIEILNRPLHSSERAVRESLPKPLFPITERIDKIEKTILKNSKK
jgi:lipopolysaccharide export system protein LptA